MAIFFSHWPKDRGISSTASINRGLCLVGFQTFWNDSQFVATTVFWMGGSTTNKETRNLVESWFSGKWPGICKGNVLVLDENSPLPWNCGRAKVPAERWVHFHFVFYGTVLEFHIPWKSPSFGVPLAYVFFSFFFEWVLQMTVDGQIPILMVDIGLNNDMTTNKNLIFVDNYSIWYW